MKTYTKRLGILRKKEGMTDQQFRDHWLNKHAELCLKLPKMRRYSVNFVDRDPRRGKCWREGSPTGGEGR